MQKPLLSFKKVYHVTGIHKTMCARLCLCVRADDQKHFEKQIYMLMCSTYNFLSNWLNRLQIHFVHRCHRTKRKMMTKVHSALWKQNNSKYFFFSPSVAISKRSLETLRVLLEMAEIWTEDFWALCLDRNRKLLPDFLLQTGLRANSNKSG